jgi:menaquinone-dependent protoporphyrinogen IX oxidase
MTKSVLVAYATNSGSTADVAQAVGKALGQDGAPVDVRRIKEVEHVDGYDAVVVGGPMILGWHREAVRFLKRHQKALSQVPVAYFMTALNLTATDETGVGDIPVYLDPRLAKPPRNPSKLSFKERYATVESYLAPALKKAPQIKPVSVAFFKGKLEYTKLNILQSLFVMLVIGATPGDFRDWDAISSWAATLPLS